MSTAETKDKSSIEAASEAIAKVNAMLVAKGKLKPSQLAPTNPASSQKSKVINSVVSEIFFGCLGGRNKAPFPMQFGCLFSQIEK